MRKELLSHFIDEKSRVERSKTGKQLIIAKDEI
jgi:hypothetical protein